MDIISFNEAATANGRIEKVIAQPDSVSGLVTMPSVVATGEVISIPTGRTVVHPNLQVDGTLDVQGTLFIPSGGSVSTTEVDATVVKQNGNVVANDSAVVHKTGDETIAGVKTFSSSPIVPNATTATQAAAFGQVVNLTANQTIAGLKIFSSNPVSSNATEAHIELSKTGAGASVFYPYNGATQLGLADTVMGVMAYMNKANPLDFIINKNLYVAGSVLLNTGGGLGYGTGSGGTVTQLTSKSTAVTLNKPSGKIIMNNASLAANSSVQFNINNSSIADGDSIKVTIVGGVGSYQSYSVDGYGIYGGGATIVLRNVTAVALAEAIVLQFTIIKGATV